MPKRKASALAAPALQEEAPPQQVARRTSRRQKASLPVAIADPDLNGAVIDAIDAIRASPGATAPGDAFAEDKISSVPVKTEVDPKTPASIDSLPSLTTSGESESDGSDLSGRPAKRAKAKKAAPKKATHVEPDPKPAKSEAKQSTNTESFLDPEAEEDGEPDEEEMQEALSRPPPVNSSTLPLPWKGRLGYACLNTYLRFATPPVFASRTCRIASILENRHPLKDPSQPPHPTKNRPDKEQPASIERGKRCVESLGLANARDCIKIIRWNHRYGIKFLRLSSEMFPFASHEEYGYKLAPFASGVLAEVGSVAGELGHRLTTHPGQYTQLGSPRKVVIDNAIRDLEYHAELLSLLKLPPQQDRDAVMIMHLGGVFGDKDATIQRFRENYANLSENVKKRLVLENDDVSYSVHDLLPLCEELNIPLVLDFHHHNIIFDADKIREGTEDIVELFPRIIATWRRKNITPKMHYSEPTPAAITGRQRRKHSPRVATLPPCPADMDLMIEAKDKEQAVLELMRTFKLPGFETFSDIVPHVRKDENKPPKPVRGKAKKKQEPEDVAEVTPAIVPDEEISMGGPEGRVYWPPGMEEWLRPKKRVIKKKEETSGDPKKPSVRPKPRKSIKEDEEDTEIHKRDSADINDEGTGRSSSKIKKGRQPAAAPASEQVSPGDDGVKPRSRRRSQK